MFVQPLVSERRGSYTGKQELKYDGELHLNIVVVTGSCCDLDD